MSTGSRRVTAALLPPRTKRLLPENDAVWKALAVTTLLAKTVQNTTIQPIRWLLSMMRLDSGSGSDFLRERGERRERHADTRTHKKIQQALLTPNRSVPPGLSLCQPQVVVGLVLSLTCFVRLRWIGLDRIASDRIRLALLLLHVVKTHERSSLKFWILRWHSDVMGRFQLRDSHHRHADQRTDECSSQNPFGT